jgi:hypothetical protein
MGKHVFTEYDLYRGLNSKYLQVRRPAEILFDLGFDMLHEIEQQLLCHELQAVLKCEAIVVVAEPCCRVRGIITQFCQRGTLEHVLR